MKPLNIDSVLTMMTNTQRAKYDALSRLSNGKRKQLDYALSFVGQKNTLDGSLDIVKHDWNTRNESALGGSVYGERELQVKFDRYKANALNPNVFHAPLLKSNDYIGVEIECLLPCENWDNEYNCQCECDCGDDCDGDCRENCDCGSSDDGYVRSVRYSIGRAKIKGVQVVTDGSLSDDNGDMFGVEFKVLFRENDYTSLKSLCDWLTKHNALVNKTCGLHVHLDARGYKLSTITQLTDTFAAALPILTRMVPTSRVKNSYCKNQVSFTDRYSAVNGEAFKKHKTLEIRLHTGSTNYEKISNWVKLLTKIKNCLELTKVEYDILDTPMTLTLVRFFDKLDLSQDMREYVYTRIEKFNPSYLLEHGIFQLVTEDTTNHEESENEAA